MTQSSTSNGAVEAIPALDVGRMALNVGGLQAELVQLIRAKIRSEGPQPFAWFMEQALYHPQYGYYSSGRAAIGRKGDYFTNVSVGSLFGRLLAAQFAEMWERMGGEDFTIVEQGAHDGQFANDVLSAARNDSPEFFEALRYRIVEPFAVWQDRQTQTLKPFHEKVEWSQSMKPFTGVHFSNELLDAMPTGTKFVGLDGDKFVFVKIPAHHGAESSALLWVDELSRNLIRGYVLIIDYGFTGEHFREVIQARAQHRHLDSPFDEIGDADITVHVNWSEIIERAKTNGLQLAGFTDQHHFLTGIITSISSPQFLKPSSVNLIGLTDQVENETAALTGKEKRELQTLLHPEMLGRAFQVLLLGKDVDLAGTLAGFKFAREAATKTSLGPPLP